MFIIPRIRDGARARERASFRVNYVISIIVSKMFSTNHNNQFTNNGHHYDTLPNSL